MSLGDFLGISKFGQGLASASRVLGGEVNQDIESQGRLDTMMQKVLYAARNEKDSGKRQRLLQLAQRSGRTASPEEIDPGLNLSNKEILGSAASLVLNVATPGAFKGGVRAVLGKNALTGAGFGLASGLEKNRSLGGVIGSTVGGALIGTAVGGVGLIAKALKNFVGVTTPRWLMNSAVKPALGDLKKNIKYGTPTLGDELLKEGVRGGPKKLLEIADSNLNKYEGQLQTILSSESLKGARISRDRIAPYLSEVITNKRGVPGMAGEVQRIEGILKSIPDSLSLSEANLMKRRIYRELRDISYKLDPKLNTRAQTLKLIAKGLKQEIETAVGGIIVKDINSKLSIYGRLEDTIVDQLARSMRNNKIGLTDAILAAGGIATGNPLAFLGAIGFDIARKAGTGVGTFAAQGLKKGGEALSGGVAQGAKEILRRGALNIP